MAKNILIKLLTLILCSTCFSIDPCALQTDSDKRCNCKMEYLITKLERHKYQDPDTNYYLAAALFSGKSFLDLGNYSYCKDSNGMIYLHTFYEAGKPLGNVSIGLCIFNECSARYLNANKSTVLDYVKKLAKHKLDFLDPEKTHFYDPEITIDNKRIDSKGAFIATLCIIGFIVVLYILNLIIVRKPKKS